MIDLALAKAHVRADGSAEDDLIQAYLDAAAAHVEGVTGKLLMRREVVQEFARFGTSQGDWLPLWWGPSPADLTIDYLDTDAAAQTVVLGPFWGSRIYPMPSGWPTPLDHAPIVVTYTAGFGDNVGAGEIPVPPDLVQAQLMLVAWWYGQREAANVGNIVSEVPLAVEAILQRHRMVLI